MRILSPPLQRARVMSFISRVNFCKAAAVCVAVVVALPLAGGREVRVADSQSEDYPTVQALMFMARLVEERTGGRHHIRVVPFASARRREGHDRTDAGWDH